jgi:hypothetical protein
MHTWKCHSETHLKQTKISFLKTKTENRKVGQVLSGELVPVGRGEIQGKSVGG